MHKNPLISVIIPTYNREKPIKRAINSVISQSYRNWELLIIDDGSIDNTYKNIMPFLKNKNIQYYYKRNDGVSEARNYGAKKAKGEYLAFLDSDDKFHKDKLIYSLIQNKKHKVDISLSNVYKVYPKKITSNKIKYNKLITYDDLIAERFGSFATLFIRKEKFIKSLYNKKFDSMEDLELIIRLLAYEKVLYVAKPLAYVYKNIEGNRLSLNFEKKIICNQLLLKNIINNNYDLVDKHNKRFRKKIYFKLCFYNALINNYKKSRYFYRKGNAIRNYNYQNIKYRTIYATSYLPFLLKNILAITKIAWKYGIFK